MTTLSGKQKQPAATRQIKTASSQQPPPTPTRQTKAATGQIKTAPGQDFSTVHFKTCSKCKEKLPADLESFPPGKGYKNGLRSVCRQCTRKYHNEWMRKKKESKRDEQPKEGQAGVDSTALPAAGKPPASKPKPQQKSKAAQDPANQPTNSKRLVIDFTDHEDILDKIQALARDEIRTPENQILYQLKQGVVLDTFNLNIDDAAH